MTLDNPALAGRLRTTSSRRSNYERRAVVSMRPRTMSDVRPVAVKTAPSVRPAAAKRSVHPLTRKPAHSTVLKREIVAPKPAHSSQTKQKKGKHSLRSKLPLALAALLFIFGLGVGINGLHTNHKVAAQVQQLSHAANSTDTSSTSVPSETPPSTGLGSYHVAPTVPRILSIPKLNVQARILRTTVNAKNELGTPSNIFDTAWYDGSAKPGEAGAVLIDGHVSGPTQNGVFYSLKTLKAGDKISLERGDGKTFSYTVVTTKVYDAADVDMAAALTPVTSGKPGLNLITCTGKLDSTSTHFQQRLVVFAAQD